MRHFNFIDRLMIEVEHGLATLSHQFQETTVSPGKSRINPELSPSDIRKSQGLMRVNHTGEICAQALYRGQALATNNQALQAHLHQAAQEEINHLIWCSHRLMELGTFESHLNGLWYSASFLLGFLTAKQSDSLSLGFVEETERQVMHHLDTHKQTLPRLDHKSRAIIDAMRDDEEAHAEQAQKLGSATLSPLMKFLMKQQARIMTQTAYFI